MAREETDAEQREETETCASGSVFGWARVVGVIRGGGSDVWKAPAALRLVGGISDSHVDICGTTLNGKLRPDSLVRTFGGDLRVGFGDALSNLLI